MHGHPDPDAQIALEVGICMTPEHLLATERGLVVAPAGCGKTYLLAETVKANTIGRILVLTHTRAGVAVIRSRLVNVPSSSYRVDTLDHWAAWIATRFPATSRYEPTNTPRDYDLAKQAAVRLLEGSTIRDSSLAPIAASSSMNTRTAAGFSMIWSNVLQQQCPRRRLAIRCNACSAFAAA